MRTSAALIRGVFRRVARKQYFFAAFKGEEIVFVFQKNGAFFSGGFYQRERGISIERFDGSFSVIDAIENEFRNAIRRRRYFRFGYFAFVVREFKSFINFAFGHRKVESRFNGGRFVYHRAPVGNDDSVEAPFAP